MGIGLLGNMSICNPLAWTINKRILETKMGRTSGPNLREVSGMKHNCNAHGVRKKNYNRMGQYKGDWGEL